MSSIHVASSAVVRASARQKQGRVPKHPSLPIMARPERFELPTTKFVAWYSIQLSYGRALKTVPRRPELRSLPLRAVESSAKARDYSDPRALRQPFSLPRTEVMR